MIGWIILSIVLLLASWMAWLAPKDSMDKPGWATWSSIKAVLFFLLLGLIIGFSLLPAENKLIKYGLPLGTIILSAAIYLIAREKEISRISINVARGDNDQSSKEIRKTAVMMHKMKKG
ncbi:MAG: hypothetical protein WD877_01330 [Candidatus Saccharimonadales bacterium]